MACHHTASCRRTQLEIWTREIHLGNFGVAKTARVCSMLRTYSFFVALSRAAGLHVVMQANMVDPFLVGELV
jgi:hypothetical protein